MNHTPEPGPAAQINEPGQTVGPVIQVPMPRVPEKMDVTVRVMVELIVEVVGTNALATFVEVM